MKKTLCTTADSQRKRLLDYLRENHPRILELRKQGYKIFTHWETIDTGKGKHRVGCYVLFSGGGDE